MEAPCTIQSTQHSHAVAPSIEFIIQNLHSMMIVYTIYLTYGTMKCSIMALVSGADSDQEDLWVEE